MLKVREDLLKMFLKLFCLWLCVSCENSCNYNSYKFSNKFLFVSFLHFPRNQKQESSIAQVGHLITKNIYVFVNGELRSTLNSCWVRYILGSNLLTCYFCSYYSFIFRIYTWKIWEYILQDLKGYLHLNWCGPAIEN